MRIAALVSIALLLAACGGPPPRHADDEVTAEWTAGDDAPLEDEAAR